MFISVYLLSVTLVFLSRSLVTSSEVITISVNTTQRTCLVLPSKIDITENADFTLKINSDHEINESLSTWKYGKKETVQISDVYDAVITIIYKNTKSSYDMRQVFTNYTFLHTGRALLRMSGIWNFSFCITEKSGNLYYGYPSKKCSSRIECFTQVQIVKNKGNVPTVPGPVNLAKDGHSFNLLLYIGPFAGVIILIQTIYIIYMQCRLRSPKTTIHRSETTETVCNNYNDSAIDISKRPPLPLPPDVINKEGPKSPSLRKKEEYIVKTTPPAPSPRPAHHQYALRSPKPAIHRCETTETVCNNYNDPRRMFPQPRSTPIPVRNPGRIQTPPILSPKPNKRSPFQAEHQRENRDSSEDEWQYEKLQPVRKYLDESFK